jgi:hypothetical protein
MRNILCVILVLTTFSGTAQTDSATEGIAPAFGKPLVWLIDYNPWAMFIGADVPYFTLYESGQVIYVRNHHFRLAMLSGADVAAMIKDFQLTDTFFVHDRYIETTEASDLHTMVLFVNLDTLKSFGIYGFFSDKLPRVFQHIFEKAGAFSDDRSREWLPDKVEVMLTDYAHSPETPVPWPAGWPDLNSPDSRHWGGDGRIGGGRIYLPIKYFPKLQQLAAKMKEKQAFLINGRKYSFGYRLAPPGVDSVMATKPDHPTAVP